MVEVGEGDLEDMNIKKNEYSSNFAFEFQLLQQGPPNSVLKGHCPTEFSSDPN